MRPLAGLIREFELPAADGQRPRWGFIGVYENLLLAGTGLATIPGIWATGTRRSKKRGIAWGPDFTGSLGLTVFDRHTGRVAVEDRRGARAFAQRHRGRRRPHLLPGPAAQTCRGSCCAALAKSVPPARLLALDARSGQVIWERTDDVFGTWLGYSQARDVLFEAGAAASDRSLDEIGKGMAAFRGADGTLLWEKPELAYAGPCILHNDVIITNTTGYKVSQGAFRLEDGRPGDHSPPADRRTGGLELRPHPRLQHVRGQRTPVDLSLGGRGVLRPGESQRHGQFRRIQVQLHLEPDRGRRGAERPRLHPDLHLRLSEPDLAGAGPHAGR